MEQMATIGLDIAKSVFQVHGIGQSGAVVVQRRLRRSQVLGFFSKLSPCVVGIEACASSHFWAREIGALGHDVRLMPAAYVKPYVKRQKNDAADAEAICEAVTRPTMRFVPVKSPEQQSIMVLHKTRQMVMRQRTKLANTIRAHMADALAMIPGESHHQRQTKREQQHRNTRHRVRPLERLASQNNRVLNAISERDIRRAPLHHLVIVDPPPTLGEPVNGWRLRICGVGVFGHRSTHKAAAMR